MALRRQVLDLSKSRLLADAVALAPSISQADERRYYGLRRRLGVALVVALVVAVAPVVAPVVRPWATTRPEGRHVAARS